MPSSLDQSQNLPVYGNFNLHVQSHGILMQFILSEFLAAHPEVRAMGSLYEGLDGQLLYETLNDEQLSCLANGLASLIGAVVEETLPLPWTHSHGALGKLKHYCQLYQSPSVAMNSAVADLQTATSKSFHAVLLARELIQQIRSPTCEQRRRDDSTTLSRLLQRLSASMDHGTQQLALLLTQYDEDENILYFLLRRHAEISELFHTSFFCELVAPRKLDQVGKFLTKRYQARGFEHIVPQIRHYLSGMNE